MGVLSTQVLERLEVQDRREPVLGPGDVEPEHAAIAILDDQLGHLEPALRVPHRREQLPDDDRVTLLGRECAALVDARLHGVDGITKRQPRGQVLLGCPAQLGVDAAVDGEVVHRLPGHPGQVLGSLHDGDRVHERLEVALERAGRRCLGEPRAQRVRALGRQLVTDLRGDLGDRGRPDAAVEVLVQGDLGRCGDLVGCRGAHPASMRSVTVSATQAGLSAPLISMVCCRVICWPFSRSLTSTISTRFRTLEPTSTGETKRTLLRP